MYRLHKPAGLQYASNALPPGGGFLDLVEVGSRCSTTQVAQPYSGVPTFSRAGGAGDLIIFHAQSGIQPARDIRLHDEYRPDVNRAGPCRAENPQKRTCDWRRVPILGVLSSLQCNTHKAPRPQASEHKRSG